MLRNASQAVPPAIRPLLQKVGMDDKQIDIYLALLSMKVARASDIAKSARQSRSHTYLILRELEKMGLVSEIEEGKILRFVAEPPERILSYLKDRESDNRALQLLMAGAMPVLTSLTSAYIVTPRVTVLKGIDGMKQVYRDILAHEFVGIYNAETAWDAFGGDIVTMLFGDDVKLQGRDLLVQNDGAKRYIKQVPPHAGYRVRLLPKGMDFATDTVVFGDMVTLFAFDDERTIVCIENGKIADTFRMWFEMMWNMSKEARR